MKKFNVLMQTVLVIVFIALVSQASAQQRPLHYGDIISLQNGWNDYQGGYLDTRGYQKDFEKTGNFLCVSTATDAKRDGGSGSWKIMSATGKAEGSPVLIDDNIYLLNEWNNNGGYLDTRGYQKDFEETGNLLCVSTATVSNRDNGSGTWKIVSAKGKAAGTAVRANSAIHLQNAWNKFAGGFLDTRGYQKDFEETGNLLCVSTATASDRDNGSGTWKIKVVKSVIKKNNTLKAGKSLKAGESLTSTNGAYMLRMQEDDGNLCIYKVENGEQGAFVWGSMKYGFTNATLTMQEDGNLVVTNEAGEPQWSSETHSFFNDKFKDANNKPVKMVLANNGTLRLHSASGAVVWTSK